VIIYDILMAKGNIVIEPDQPGWVKVTIAYLEKTESQVIKIRGDAELLSFIWQMNNNLKSKK